ncbi:MAG: protein translocase subunit SecD [Gemmatimonadetes bacterium]|nr:protein translocase subunit SecD [Gemmatimonadota bacterium]NNK49312.1 protein translocase subunit SecD [Gemmatimonadota bacterium]
MRKLRSRLLVILGLIIVSVYALVPKTGPAGDKIPAINLGLDLQGGMHLAVEVDDPDGTLTTEARADALERTLTTIRNRIDEFGVREPTIQRVGSDRIIVELAGIDDPERAKAIVERTAFLEFKLVREDDNFRNALPRIDRGIVQELGAENLTGSAIEESEPESQLSDILGTRPDSAVEAAADSADVQLEVTTPDTMAPAQTGAQQDTGEPNLRPLTGLLLESGNPGILLVVEEEVPTVERYLATEAFENALPRNTELRWGAAPTAAAGAAYRELYVLEADAILTGDLLQDAGPAARDPQFNQPYVPFETTRRGSRVFQRGTAPNVGRYMAIVLDSRVQSAPVIRQTLSRRAQIEMGAGSSFQEAQDLALVLRAGALPMPIKVVEEHSVSASLGADSIRQGRNAFIIGIIGVVLLMMWYYRVAGIMAVAALAVYVLLVLGGLAGLGATLTLPGIAGLILSVGMAVDANVLIFERIREESDAGKTPRTAVDAGFAQALSAIVDANLTTLITAAILYQFGTGPIRGFAVTLVIGIIASFFTALYVTRTFFLVYLERRSPTEPLSI